MKRSNTENMHLLRDQPAYIVSRCTGNRLPYIMRFRKKESGWVVENATAIPERSAGGGDVLSLSGAFTISPTYPGCPHCKHGGIFLCACNKLNCYDGQASKGKCGWCAKTVTLGAEITSLSGTSG